MPTPHCDKCIHSLKKKVQADRTTEETACFHKKVNVFIFNDNPGCKFFQADPKLKTEVAQ